MNKGSRWGIPSHQRALYINDAGDVLSGSVYWSRLGNFHQQLVVSLIFVILIFSDDHRQLLGQSYAMTVRHPSD